MKNTLLPLLLLFSVIQTASAQTDTQFWFVAPAISPTHANKPVYLRMSTLKTASVITISMPANASFIPISISLGPTSSFSQDLTPFINLLENGNPSADIVENKGLLITATANINLYYEVLGRTPGNTTVLNSDIFSLKGANALGTSFYTPFQDRYPNSNPSIPLNPSILGASSFDIVATEDNTVVTITPTKDIVGHAANSTFSITLNRGQTYSAKAVGKLGVDHLTGSKVVATKKIAVTVKDDSVVLNNAIDLDGDQLVPVQTVGNDYIIVKGQLNNNEDLAIIVATADNDSVKIGGILKIVMNAGGSYTYPMTVPAEYVHTSQPSYVYHLSGFGDEIGGALLPPIKCTGSRQVAVTRDTDESFFLNILVKSGGEKYFKLNGNATLIPASQFTTVPGTPTPGSYKYAAFSLPVANVPSGSNNFITNDSADFHLAVINGTQNGASCRYGYFSDYGSATLKLGGNITICQGDQHTFDIGNSFSNIIWKDGSTNTTLVAGAPGKYWVQGTKGECIGRDTALLIVNTLPSITRQPAGITLCAKLNATFEAAGAGKDSSFQWEVSKDGGASFTSVQDSSNYTGSKTTKLNISSLQVGMNGYVYRFANKGACPPVARSAPATLNVKDCEVVIPDVFTPRSKDGKNDYFVIQGNEPNSKLEIFNRWGTPVYQSTNYNNDWSGENVSDGIYFYIYSKLNKPPFTGWVQVLN